MCHTEVFLVTLKRREKRTSENGAPVFPGKGFFPSPGGSLRPPCSCRGGRVLSGPPVSLYRRRQEEKLGLLLIKLSGVHVYKYFLVLFSFSSKIHPKHFSQVPLQPHHHAFKHIITAQKIIRSQFCIPSCFLHTL